MKVLQVSQDRMVLQSRALLLMQALPGCEVVSVSSYAEAVAACASSAFDLAVIGTGLSETDKIRLHQYVRQTLPAARLIEVHQGIPLLKCDLDWEAGSDPASFVDAIQRLVNRKTKAAAAIP